MHIEAVHDLLPLRRRAPRLLACSVCLRVRHGSGWVAPERVIRELRSYEFDRPPRLRPAVCDSCVAELRARRAKSEDREAA